MLAPITQTHEEMEVRSPCMLMAQGGQPHSEASMLSLHLESAPAETQEECFSEKNPVESLKKMHTHSTEVGSVKKPA